MIFIVVLEESQESSSEKNARSSKGSRKKKKSGSIVFDADIFGVLDNDDDDDGKLDILEYNLQDKMSQDDDDDDDDDDDIEEKKKPFVLLQKRSSTECTRSSKKRKTEIEFINFDQWNNNTDRLPIIINYVNKEPDQIISNDEYKRFELVNCSFQDIYINS